MNNRTVTADATWDGTKAVLVTKARYKAECANRKWEVGTALKITVGPVTRSQRANSYYWGVVLEHIVRLSDTGYDAQELHDVFCERFIASEKKQVAFYSKLTGQIVATDVDTRRSSALTGGPFYDYVEKVRQFAQEFWGIETPDPDPEYWRKREDKAA
jgi:hypothetical protein